MVFTSNLEDTVIIIPRRRFPSRRFLLWTLLLCALPFAIAWWRREPAQVAARPYRFPTPELAALDRATQARFAVVPDKDFGLRRMGPRHGYFYPAIASEKVAVKNLQKAQQEVVFYVVGRNVILQQSYYNFVSPVQGPVYITPKAPLRVESNDAGNQRRFISPDGVAKDAPSDSDLIALSRRVFDDGALKNGTDGKIGEWNVVARPVAASAQQCVDCHNSRPARKPAKTWDVTKIWNARDKISLGDTLGIALYCYRPARKIETKKLTEAEIIAKPGQ